MQSASTDDLIFDVATLVSLISVGITLEPGDIIVTGTPSGVGAARKPPVFMKAATSARSRSRASAFCATASSTRAHARPRQTRRSCEA